jgi:hypothetical protein
MVMLKFYGDESADDTNSRVFSVAGVIGTEDEWAEAMRLWLRRTRGLPFHANKCESQFAKTDREKHEGNLKLYRDLTVILAESHLVGIAVSLDIKSRDECLPGIPKDFGYYKCLTDVLVNLGQITRAFNADPNEPEDAKVEFTFASRVESDGTAGTIYRMFRTLPEWADTSIFDAKVSFEAATKEPRLEVADLLAREAMKEVDRKLTQSARPQRRSFQALDNTGKLIWIERDRAYCERWLDQVNSEQGKADLENYKKWLVDTKRVQNGQPHDNMTNRALFYGWWRSEMP